MPSGRYDHPTYLTRQVLNMGLSTAGANGTSASYATLPWDVDAHSISAVVAVAGTSAGNTAILVAGTATVGSVILGTNTAGTVVIGTDAATKVPAGSLLAMKNGTDATGTYRMFVEYNLAPSATWLGVE